MASTFRFVWDGNVLLHETFKKDNSENTELTTWIFEGFVPTAKLVNGKAYSIISDHLGTPILAIDSEGNEVWNRQLDIYGRVKREIKASSLGEDVRPFIPFLYQGQYYDFETNLAYNRYRYYSPETGSYISQDPIGLAGGNPTLYGYVGDNNTWVDRFGLAGDGGSYIFDITITFTDGRSSDRRTYIGKGQEDRMRGSQGERINQLKKEYAKDKNVSSIVVTAAVHNKTGNNNTLGTMVENRLMYNAGFKKGKVQPAPYLNTYFSGNTAWNNEANAHLRNEANEIAKLMEEELNKQRNKLQNNCPTK